MPVRLGISPSLSCEPLVAPLRPTAHLALVRSTTLENAVALREGRLEAAFLSPLDYARDGSLYRIVPGVALSSTQANNAVVLQFRGELRDIQTLAVDASSSSEIILARLILAEEFDSEPAIVPVTTLSAEEMLRRADAALLAGDAALREARARRTSIDLVEEWHELSGLPYVHGVWCGRDEHALSPDDLQLLQDAAVRGSAMVDRLAAEAAARGLGTLTPADLAEYLDGFSYELTDAAAEGLREFLRYAYYHGILPDVPELNFFPSSAAANGGEDLPSAN